MRIGVVSHLYPTKRSPVFGNFIKEELDFLAKHVEIRLIAPYPNQRWFVRDQQVTYEKYPVVRPFTLAFPRWFMQKLYPESMAFTLGRYGRDFFDGCDIVHAHNAFPDGVASVKAFGKRMPVMVTVHGSDVNVFAMKPALRPGIVKTLNRMERIICVSKSLSEKLNRIGVSSKIEIIPNGVDTDLFSPGDRTGACKSLGFDPDRPRIIFVGNFTEVKGVEYLIRSMPIVLKVYPDCELVLLGARPGSKDIMKYDELIKSVGIEDIVKIVTIVPHKELPVWFRASDIMVLPSIHEGFGLVAAEALACGRPVVATKCGGPEDIVKEGLGILVPSGDFEALGEGIVSVLDGDEIISSSAMAQSIHDRFSYNIISRKIVSVYKDILEEL